MLNVQELFETMVCNNGNIITGAAYIDASDAHGKPTCRYEVHVIPRSACCCGAGATPCSGSCAKKEYRKEDARECKREAKKEPEAMQFKDLDEFVTSLFDRKNNSAPKELVVDPTFIDRYFNASSRTPSVLEFEGDDLRELYNDVCGDTDDDEEDDVYNLSVSELFKYAQWIYQCKHDGYAAKTFDELKPSDQIRFLYSLLPAKK